MCSNFGVVLNEINALQSQSEKLSVAISDLAMACITSQTEEERLNQTASRSYASLNANLQELKADMLVLYDSFASIDQVVVDLQDKLEVAIEERKAAEATTRELKALFSDMHQNMNDVMNKYKKIDPKTIICPECEEAFGSSFSYNRHYRTVHERKYKYKCPHCNHAGFENKTYLMKHLKNVHQVEESDQQWIEE